MVTAEHAKLVTLIVFLSLVAGVADALGFVHAARIWQEGKIAWKHVGKSAMGFSTGIAVYWLTLKYMHALGIVTPEVQTIVWFSTTLLGVAVVSGEVFKWRPLDQGVAVAVMCGIGWLLIRTRT